jgi:hypothetical protein
MLATAFEKSVPFRVTYGSVQEYQDSVHNKSPWWPSPKLMEKPHARLMMSRAIPRSGTEPEVDQATPGEAGKV